MTDESLIREVDEEVRRDEFKKLWDRFGSLFTGLAVLMAVYHPWDSAAWLGFFFAVGFIIAVALGAYLVWFPGATVRVVIPIFVLIFIPIPIPAWIMPEWTCAAIRLTASRPDAQNRWIC